VIIPKWAARGQTVHTCAFCWAGILNPTRHLVGFHAVTARLRHHPEGVQTLYVEAARHDRRMRELVERAEAAKVDVQAVDERRLQAMAGHGRHQGVVAVVDSALPHVTLEDVLDSVAEAPLLLILDGVTDPHNLGACLRSADAFGVHAIVVPKDRAVGVNATVAKAASGAADTVPVVTVTNLARAMRDLKERGVWLVAADVDASDSLFEAELSGPLAWVLGAEGSGLRRLTRELCDRVVSIPLQGSVGSLNVSVAAGVCLYETRRQRSRPG
jgi:23S rRNA (guanosine2251-2'-O)-methyltransferase